MNDAKDLASYRLFREAKIRCSIQNDAVADLFQLSYHDPTVKRFLDAWQYGSFQSFEQMLCRLTVQLAEEKAEYLKTATKALQNSKPPSFILCESLPNQT